MGAIDTLAAKALCGVVRKALVAQGVPDTEALAMAEAACVARGGPMLESGRKKVAKKAKKTGKKMTRKTQLAINRGRKRSGLKPIRWKRKGR